MRYVAGGCIGFGCALLTDSIWKSCVATVMFVIAANLYRDAR